MMRLFQQALRLVLGLLRWLYTKLWKEPKDIRGAAWTAALYISIACAFEIARRGQLLPLAIGLLSLWVMKRESKPKRLGRPLPYWRKR